MIEGLLFALLSVAVACPVSDGSPELPFYVDSAGTGSPATGSSCAPFASLEATLMSASSLPAATISLLSNISLPAWNFEKEVTLRGNYNVLDLAGAVSVPGVLRIAQAHVISKVEVEFVLDVTGSLLLDSCNVTSFTSLPMHVKGQVSVINSVFRGNVRGVFAAFLLGGSLTIAQSRFVGNAGKSGAVFLLSPASGQGSTQYSISNCVFEGNGAKGLNSVLALNDFGVPSSTGKQTILFARCSFSGHPAPTFQLISKLFSLNIQEGTFENETQIVTGVLAQTNATLSHLAVTKCKGPLFVLQLAGVFNLTSSNFTYIQSGPFVVVAGAGVSLSLVCLTQVRLSYISNNDKAVLGNLVSAKNTAIWMDHVLLANFTAGTVGVFHLFQSELFSKHFSAKNGTAGSSIVGTSLYSGFTMSDTTIESLNSGGAMWLFYQSSVNITRITYRRIVGNYVPSIGIYTTNLFTIWFNSTGVVQGLDFIAVVQGTSLIYVYNSSLIFTNSVVTGPIGMTAFSSNGGTFILRQVAFNITSALIVVRTLAGGVIDIDQLFLRDAVIRSSVAALSSGSSMRIQSLVLSNVTCTALSGGSRFSIALEDVYIENSRIGPLLDSGIYV